MKCSIRECMRVRKEVINEFFTLPMLDKQLDKCNRCTVNNDGDMNNTTRNILGCKYASEFNKKICKG